MDDLVTFGVVLLLVGGVGWLVGIIGFFRAGRALRELRALRATLSVPVPAPSQSAAAESLPPAPEPAPLEPEPMPAPQAPVPPAPPRRTRDWEELLTARWGVWVGAGALLLAGVFLVRYAADEGLLGPGVRCVAAVLLAVALIAAAEWLGRRSRGPARLPDYAPGALAAGGVAVLFAAAYMAGPLYALVPAFFGFALLAAASLAGLALSLRFGPLVAAVGLVGAFATPLLVQTDAPAWPGLFAYLLCVAAASLAVMRYTAWVWLGWASAMACAGYILLATLVGAGSDTWAPALFGPAVALLTVLLLPGAALEWPIGRRLASVPLAALGGAELLLAFAVPSAWLARLGVLLLAAVTVGKAATEPRIDRLSWLGGLLFLLLVAGWGLPSWHLTGEPIVAGDAVIATLPDGWAPAALQPLLLTAILCALLFFAAGLWGERRRPHPLRWSVLAASVPVLALAILYARVTAFQTDALWAGAALAVAALGTLAAGAAAREGGRDRAGAHAAGATAALALGCAAVLTGQWLTVALALFVPALAAIEHAAELPPLRRVALAVAILAACRLLLNDAVLQEAAGQPPVLDGLIPAYGVAAAGFAMAARMLRRRADDLPVAVLELCAAAFVAALAVLEVRQWSTGGHPDLPGTGFQEVALDTSALAVLAVLAWQLRLRTGRRTLGWAAHAGGGIALAAGIALLLVNPAFVSDAVPGAGLLLNALLPAYAIPAAVAAATLRLPGLASRIRSLLLGYAVVAAFAYVTLLVRHAFHPEGMAFANADVTDAELWTWSGAWLAFGLATMAIGIVIGRKTLRLAALAIVGLTGAKVFLVDMGDLVGLWRVLSFLGLGLTLIGLGAVYRRFVSVPASETATEPAPPPS